MDWLSRKECRWGEGVRTASCLFVFSLSVLIDVILAMGCFLSDMLCYVFCPVFMVCPLAAQSCMYWAIVLVHIICFLPDAVCTNWGVTGLCM